MDFFEIFQKMLLLLIVIAVGAAATRFRVMDEKTNDALSDLVISVTLPCSILYSVVNSDRLLDNLQVVSLTFLGIAVALAMIVFSKAMVVVLKVPLTQRNLCRYMMIFSNSAFIGFPVLKAVFGPDSVFYAAVYNMVSMILSYTYGIVLISGEGNRESRTIFDVKMLLTPVMISSVFAYIMYLLNLQLPEIITETLGFIDPVTSPLSLLCVGCSLAGIPAKKVLSAWRVHLAIALRMILFPVLCFYILQALGVPLMINGVVTVIAAMPTAASTTMFCARYGNDQQLASSAIFVTTLLSAVTIPLLCRVLF